VHSRKEKRDSAAPQPAVQSDYRKRSSLPVDMNEASERNTGQVSTAHEAQNKRLLSRQLSVMYRPTPRDNKLLEHLLAKVDSAGPEPRRARPLQDQHHPL